MARAETDLSDMTRAERQAFGAEIRALLLDEPEIVTKVLDAQNPASQETRTYIDDDLALLDELASHILDGAAIAIFIPPECDACEQVIQEVHEITKSYGVTVKLHDLTDPQSAKLAEKFGLTDEVFYVMPQMILRGHMPRVVLERYLAP